MTISAKQSQVTFIGGPILESARPSVLPILRLYLFGWVNVVYIKGAIVIISACYALPAKLLNKLKLALPIARPFVRLMAMLIPIIPVASRRAEAVIALLTALFALSFFSPPRSKVAGLLAILSGSIRNSIRMSFKRLRTMPANHFNLCVLSHGNSYIKVFAHYTPKYFDVACERIDNAYRQKRMFP